jgi:hypothetical protein
VVHLILDWLCLSNKRRAGNHPITIGMIGGKIQRSPKNRV